MDSEQDTEELSPQPLEGKERKRYQNRLAQRTYRRKQRAKLRALEEAVGRSSDERVMSSVTDLAAPTQCAHSCSPSDDQLWTFTPSLQEFSSTDLNLGPGHTALHRAVSNGNECIVRFLIERGADIRRQDNSGRTALHLAVENGCESVIRALLENVEDPNVIDSLGRTALFLAVENENEMVAELLLSKSIDVNRRDIMGNVALHIAVDRNSETLILLLLEHGADIDA